jgi:hypothetical protein
VNRLAALLAGIALTLAVSACGSDDEPARTAAPPEPQQQASKPAADDGESEAPAAETVADRPGCGALCQQAGPPAGTDNPGCPGNDSDNCAPCPEGGCAEVLTPSAGVQDGVFAVEMSCNVAHRCAGALHVYVPGTIGDPVAASDVSVPAHETANVPIALTPFGRHVVGTTGEFEGSVYVFLKGTGVDQLGAEDFISPTVRLSSPRAELVACGGGIRVAANTSCPFAENVYDAYGDGAMALTAHSPTTGRSYQMRCSSDATNVYCTGGDDAFVTFPEGGR